MKFFTTEGKLIKKRGKVSFYRTDWEADNVKHDLYKSGKTMIATNAVRPWQNGGYCNDLLCYKCKIWFKVIKNGFDIPSKQKRFDLWECPKCKAQFVTE